MNLLDNSAATVLEITDQETQLKLGSLKIKRWLRTDEVALYLGTTVGAVKNMALRGKLRPKKYCRRNYYCREEIDSLIEHSDIERRIQWGLRRK